MDESLVGDSGNLKNSTKGEFLLPGKEVRYSAKKKVSTQRREQVVEKKRGGAASYPH